MLRVSSTLSKFRISHFTFKSANTLALCQSKATLPKWCISYFLLTTTLVIKTNVYHSMIDTHLYTSPQILMNISSWAPASLVCEKWQEEAAAAYYWLFAANNWHVRPSIGLVLAGLRDTILHSMLNKKISFSLELLFISSLVFECKYPDGYLPSNNINYFYCVFSRILPYPLY